MATEININTLIARMEKIIQYNESLFDRHKEGKNDGRIFVQIIKGTPLALPSVYPTLLLIPGNPVRDPAYMGTNAYYNRIRIVARVLVSLNDAEQMQSDLLDIEYLLRLAFEGNRTLIDPESTEDAEVAEDPLVKHIIGEKSIMLANMFDKANSRIVDGMDIPFLMEQSSGG